MKLTVVFDADQFVSNVSMDQEPGSSKDVRQIIALIQGNMPQLAERLVALHENLLKKEQGIAPEAEGPAATEPAEVEIVAPSK